MIFFRDDFFTDTTMIDEILNGNFSNTKSPYDGVTYPAINRSIPDRVYEYVITQLIGLMGVEIKKVTMFARATHALTAPAPHRIHSDVLMGTHASQVYLSKNHPKTFGTSFWRHNEEGLVHTKNTNVSTIQSDMYSTDNWTKEFLLSGKFNRILVHEADLWHSAEPFGGWGSSPKNGRVVLTTFFSTF